MNKKLVLIFIVIITFACKKADTGANNTNPPVLNNEFSKGADISWLSQMEAAGMKFYNSSGTNQDCIEIMKSLGMNAVRLRVWVNPPNGWCNTADLVTKALRAKALGMRILLDFHYSDSWADPGKQTKPAAWANQSLTELLQSVSAHTLTVLNALKTNGITPAWVQIGNETNNGMLWPDGKASVNMNNFAQMIIAGYDAVKSIDPSIKVLVHISNGYDNSLFRWMFDGLKDNGAKWDIIGMSLYPTASNWQALNTQCLNNMNDMVSRYEKEVMVVEIGISWIESAACKLFISDLISKVKGVQNGRGLGVFYWEPQAYNNWQGYSLGAFDNTGKPTIALSAFN